MVKQFVISLHDFTEDQGWENDYHPLQPYSIENQIEGVQLARLVTHTDERGDLTVLHTPTDGDKVQVPHVCLVKTNPGAIRAWSYHRYQRDRFVVTEGLLRVVLYDIRPGSPTYGRLNVLDVGSENKVQIVIPPMVVHGVKNIGDDICHFINMPSTAYDASSPDKWRLPWDHPGIPYRFDL